MEKEKSGFATTALVLGIVGIVLSFVPIINNLAAVLGLLAVIFGLISLIKKRGKGKALAGLILGILAIVITLVLQNSWSKSLDEASNSIDKMTGENTEEVLSEDLNIEFGELEIVTDEYGLTTSKLPVTVTNISDEQKSFDVQIEALDSDGNRIYNDSIYVTDLGKGQSQTVNAFEYIEDDLLEGMQTATFNVFEASSY